MFKKVLIANRGEIARRIIIACHELGITAVAVYSEADVDAPWVRLADESYPLPGISATDSYLNQEAIFRAARLSGAEAIHPGYGFLSENATFAAACTEHGLVFIGPGPEAMQRLGNKASARDLAQHAGVPVVPGVDGANLNRADLAAVAAGIGYPLLIKASAGGGGKGMRVVQDAASFPDALRQAQNEARSAFGDDHVLIEKYFSAIHHVEVQILGDQNGTILHLFERECSIQRRHQKIIEESPAPAVADSALRRAITAAAVNLAEAAGYVNAGTVEFIVDQDGQFYFLEMNTRLQVEHPVTEQVTGLDLAVWQIRIAAGEALPISQSDLAQRGHALECRIYAEDPAQDFLPSVGTLTTYRPPSGPGLRVDDGITEGTAVTPYYDPMLAKVITWGADRPEAIRKMVRALREMVILGVTTNIPYLLDILREPDFRAGHTTTDYLPTHFAGWEPREEVDETVWLAAALFEFLHGRGAASGAQVSSGDTPDAPDPWTLLPAWRNVRS